MAPAKLRNSTGKSVRISGEKTVTRYTVSILRVSMWSGHGFHEGRTASAAFGFSAPRCLSCCRFRPKGPGYSERGGLFGTKEICTVLNVNTLMYLRITVALSLAFLAGCSTETGHPEDAPDPSAPPLAIFFTENGNVKTGDVLCDGMMFVHMTAPAVFALQLEPGDHTLSFEQRTFNRMRFERGKQYFFMVMAPDGQMFISSRSVFSFLHCNNCGANAAFNRDLAKTVYGGIPGGIPTALFKSRSE